MNAWMCRLCLTLPEGEGLKHHVAAHARESVYSFDEIDQAVQELRALAAHCDDCRAQIRRDARPATIAEAWAELGRAWKALVDDVNRTFKPWHEKLRDAGLLEPPADPKARALWAVKNRSTGPARPSGPSARRPRRHQ